MLFAQGTRPDQNTVSKIIAELDDVTVTHRPAAKGDNAAGWLEVLTGGLAFDICGLSPEQPVEAAQFLYPTDPAIAALDDPVEAISIAPGPHLTTDHYVLPILRGLLNLSARLSEHMPGLLAIGWPPSGSSISPEHFRSGAKAWQRVGTFPAEMLIGFKDAPDHSLQSRGLAAITGQELWLGRDLCADRGHAARLAYRLIHHLVHHGRLDTLEEIIGPEGHALLLDPTCDAKFVKVRRG